MTGETPARVSEEDEYGKKWERITPDTHGMAI